MFDRFTLQIKSVLTIITSRSHIVDQFTDKDDIMYSYDIALAFYTVMDIKNATF